MRIARGVLLGRWPFPASQRFGAAFLRLYLINEVLDRAITAATCLATFLIVWLAVPVEGHTLFGFRVYGWIAAAAAAWFGIHVAQRGSISGRLVGATTAGLLAFLFSGRQVLLNLGIAAAIAIAGYAARQGIETAMVAVRERPPRRLGGLRSLRVRDRWIAACGAVADNRPHIARQIWRHVARDQRLPAATRAGAFAALAELALEAGDLQAAVEQADQAVELAGGAARSCGPVYVTAGLINLAAGDNDKARDLLDHRSISRRDPRRSAARAEVLALDRDAATAMAELESSSIGLLKSGRVAGLIDLEVTILSHLLGTGTSPDAVWHRLESLLSVPSKRRSRAGSHAEIPDRAIGPRSASCKAGCSSSAEKHLRPPRRCGRRSPI